MAMVHNVPCSTEVDGVTQPAQLVFRNDTSSWVNLVWVGFQGDRQVYTTIQSGQTYVQNTFSTHTWVAEDPTGGLCTVYQGASSRTSPSR